MKTAIRWLVYTAALPGIAFLLAVAGLGLVVEWAFKPAVSEK